VKIFYLLRATALGVSVLLLASGHVYADWKPSRPLTLIVPFAPGGPSDTVARVIGQGISKELGQNVIVENVAGASGTIGAARLAQANPDGMTLLFHHLALLAAPAFIKSLTYDTSKAFAPLGVLNNGPMVLVARKDLGARTLADLQGISAKQGRTLNFAHAGSGTNPHLCGLVLGKAFSDTPQYIPYRGTAPALTDLLAGRVDLLCDQLTTMLPQIRSGALIALAVTSPEPVAELPDVATASSVLGAGTEISVWNGLYAPAGTPDNVLNGLNAAISRALDEPDIQARFKEFGLIVTRREERTREFHQKLFKSELERWSKVVRDAIAADEKAK
jgi:tripartite-type tricarboxylate transporter receptor subunit TctC